MFFTNTNMFNIERSPSSAPNDTYIVISVGIRVTVTVRVRVRIRVVFELLGLLNRVP